MFITVKKLAILGACHDGKETFRKYFPFGGFEKAVLKKAEEDYDLWDYKEWLEENLPHYKKRKKEYKKNRIPFHNGQLVKIAVPERYDSKYDNHIPWDVFNENRGQILRASVHFDSLSVRGIGWAWQPNQIRALTILEYIKYFWTTGRHNMKKKRA